MSSAIDEVIATLSPGFEGELIQPGHHDYDSSREIWNGMFDRRPGLIARCAGVRDVQAVVTAASATELPTAVRCGGHSIAGYSVCDDGVLLDLSLMRGVDVDVDARIGRAQGGCLLGSVDNATQVHGLAYPAGVVSHTGAAGLILGGGVGWLSRRFGLSCDNVEGFTMVAADSSLVHSSETDNPDLFWALRGGGGNFGVVTEFELRLHPVTSAMIGGGFCPENDIPRAVQAWHDYMGDAPDELKWSMALRLAPARDDVPEVLHGKPVASAAIVWTGDMDEGNRVIDEVLALLKPEGQMKMEMPFLELQTFADDEFPHGRNYYSKSGYFEKIDGSTIDVMMKYLPDIPSPTSQIELSYQGGAVDRLARDDTAYEARGWPLLFNLLGSWESEQDNAENIAWVRGLFNELQPSTTPGFYVNFASDDDGHRVNEAYSGTRLQRLVEVKNRYDGDNFFRLNQNIMPAGAGEEK